MTNKNMYCYDIWEGLFVNNFAINTTNNRMTIHIIFVPGIFLGPTQVAFGYGGSSSSLKSYGHYTKVSGSMSDGKYFL